MPIVLSHPAADEYAPYYAGYVAGVPAGDLLAELDADLVALRGLLDGMDDETAGTPPAPGKWSVKDVLLHVADTERVMSYRLLRVARGDATPLPGFEQDDYARTGDAGSRSLASLVDELAAVRGATRALLASLPADAFARRGTASGHPVSARALAFIVAGHARHHLRQLQQARGLAASAASAVVG